MKLKKKISSALLGAIMLLTCAFGLTACGGDGGSVSKNGKVIVSVAMLNTEKKSFENIKKAYESLHNDVEIRIKGYTSYETEMTGYVRNKNWPDIVWTAGDQHAGYSGAGHFLNLKDFADNDKDFSFEESGIYQVLLDSTHYSPTDTGYWFMPRDYNIPIIFVNKKHFEKAGIDFEEVKSNWNYETFLSVCSRLKTAYAGASDTNKDNMSSGFLSSSYPLELDAIKMSNFTGIVKSFGGQMLDTSKNTVEEICTFGTADSVAAYKEFYETFYKSGYVDPTDTNQSLFNQKKSGMWLAVRPEVASIPASIDYDFLPTPFTVSGVGCGGYAITAKSATKDANGKKVSDYAWEFLKYVVSTDGQNELSKSGLLVPAIESLKDSGVWTTYGNTASVTHNHSAFTDTTATTLVGLNDIKLFAPQYVSNVDKDLISLVTFCIQYNSSNFETDFAAKATEVINRIKGYSLA